MVDFNKDKAVIITQLAELPEDTILNKVALAEILNRHSNSIDRYWMKDKVLPRPFDFIGGQKFWTVKQLKNHINSLAEKAALTIE